MTMPSSRAEPAAERLRADWLKLRGSLFDPSTRLPALPSLIDDVRRRLEDGERLGLIYIDLSSQGEAERACGWQTHDEVVRRVAEELGRFCRQVLGRSDALAQCAVRSDDFVLFVGAEAEERLDRLHEEVESRLRHALAAIADIDAAAQVDSAVALLQVEPTMRIERAIYRAVDCARSTCNGRSAARRTGRRAALERLLAAGEIATRYQPIVELAASPRTDSAATNGDRPRLDGRCVYGVEALSAAPGHDVFETTEMLFAFAEESGAAVELERLCRRRAIARAAGMLQSGTRLFLNCSADAIADDQLVRDLVEGTAAVGGSPEQIVLEVTERTAITEWRTFRRALDAARATGAAVAIDDMGSGYSSLHTVAEIEPDYLKFDFSLVHRIHRSPIKRDLLESLTELAHKIGARPIAEGIEMAEELACVTDLGVALGQGYLFARPAGAT